MDNIRKTEPGQRLFSFHWLRF